MWKQFIPGALVLLFVIGCQSDTKEKSTASEIKSPDSAVASTTEPLLENSPVDMAPTWRNTWQVSSSQERTGRIGCNHHYYEKGYRRKNVGPKRSSTWDAKETRRAEVFLWFALFILCETKNSNRK